jgi:hypothetical protein
MAGRRRLGYGAMAAALARLDEWGSAGLMGYRLSAGRSRPSSPSRTSPVQRSPFWPSLIATLGRQFKSRHALYDGDALAHRSTRIRRVSCRRVPIYRSYSPRPRAAWGNPPGRLRRYLVFGSCASQRRLSACAVTQPGRSAAPSERRNPVESGCGAVVLGRPCRLPPLSSGGALVGRP